MTNAQAARPLRFMSQRWVAAEGSWRSRSSTPGPVSHPGRVNFGNKHVTISSGMVELRGYIDEKENQPFARWFSGLDHDAAARVTTAPTRIEQGYFSKVKGVGGGVFECRIDFGPAIASTSGKTATGW